MKTINMRIADSFHEVLRDLAKEEGVSINHFVTAAVSEKMSALLTLDYIQKRGAKISKKEFEKILAKARTQKPEEWDRI